MTEQIVYKEVHLKEEVKTLKDIAKLYSTTTVKVYRILHAYYPEHHGAEASDMEYTIILNGIPMPAFVFRHAKEAMDLYREGKIKLS